MGTGGFGPDKIINLYGDVWISRTVTTTWFIMACLFVFALYVKNNLKDRPNGFQVVVEAIVTGIYGLVKMVMGEDKMAYAPYIGTLLLFIACSNLSGLVGLRPPTADMNTTLCLSMMTFFLIHGSGVKRKGLSYFKGFIEPNPVMLPLNLIGELATPISLGFRLFGNITGGLVIMSLLYGALSLISVGGVPIGMGIPVPAFLHIYFDVFAGILQSFIFSMLTMVFVAMAMD